MVGGQRQSLGRGAQGPARPLLPSVQPEGDPGYGVTYYTISVKRDVPQYSFYGIALGALFLPVLAS